MTYQQAIQFYLICTGRPSTPEMKQAGKLVLNKVNFILKYLGPTNKKIKKNQKNNKGEKKR